MYVLLYLKNYLITYIQRFRLLSYCLVLATEDTTLTQQVSHRLLKCRSRSWSQRGTKVNGSHHGDNPLLRPTGIQIATKPLPGPTNREHRKPIKKFSSSYYTIGGLHEDKLCDTLQAMAPTKVKTVHQTSFFHIESNLDRLGLLSPTHGQRSQQ